MADVKTYQIVINGLTESISAVDSLNKQLDILDKKIAALQGKAVNVSVNGGDVSLSSGGGDVSRSSELSDEDKLLKQIENTQSKINQADMADYKVLLDKKNELKELVKEQKSMTAEARLSDNAYANTMLGMKQHLADIKAVMQTVDLNDSDTFEKLTKDANELNSKLLEIEKSYGQFGRQVGHYEIVAEGFKGLKITVGDTVREFSSSREALRALREELNALSVAGEGNSEEAEKLKEAYNGLKSAIDDATVSSKAMDEAMDMMQSFTALGSIGSGLKAFFGFDDNEISKSIQSLVSLQNVLKGIETIKKQIDTGEGLGGMFSRGSKAVDTFVSKLTGAKIAMNGLTMSSKAATVAVRALSLALKSIGIGILLEGVTMAVEGLKKLGSAIADSFKTAEKQVAALDETMNGLSRTYSYLIEENNKLYNEGKLSYLEYYTEQLRLQDEYLQAQVQHLRDRAAINGESNKIGFWTLAGDQTTGFGERIGEGTTFMTRDLLTDFSYTVNNLEEAKKAFEELNTAIMNGNDYWSEYGNGFNNWLESLTLTVSDTRDLMKSVGEGIVNDLIARISEAESEYARAMEDLKNGVDGAADRVKAAEAKIKSLQDEMNSDRITSSIIANLDKYIPDDDVRKRIQNIINSIGFLKKAMDADASDVEKYFHNLSIRLLPENEQMLARLQDQYENDLRVYGRTEEQKAQITAVYEKERAEIIDKQNKKIISSNGRHNNDLERQTIEAERDLNNLRIQNMKEGLNKILAQLEEERKAKLAKIRQSGILVAERELEVNKQYDKKIEEEKKKHAEQIEKITNDMYERLYNLSIKNLKRQEEIEKRGSSLNRPSNLTLNQNISSYGVQGKRTFSPITADGMKIKSNDDSEYMQRSKQLMDLSREMEAANTILDTAQKEYDRKFSNLTDKQKEKFQELIMEATDAYNKFSKIYQQEKDEMAALYGEEKVLEDQRLLALESYSSRLSYIYNQRQRAIENYWYNRIYSETESAKKLYEKQAKLETESYNRLYDEQRRANEKSFEEALENGDKMVEMWKQQGLSEAEAKKEADKYYERLYDENQKALESLEKEHAQKLLELEQEKNDSIQKINSEALQARLQEFRDFTTAINELEAKQPVLNAWGITNFKETNENNRNLLESYEHLAEDIFRTKEKLQEQLNSNEISFDDFQNANRELDRFTADLGQKMDKVREELTVINQVGQFIQDIQQYVQAFGNAIQTVMQANNEYQDYLFDKQQEDLDKQNEILEKKLNEQEEILQKHKSAVDSIEDELATARGDRRQHLIDQLNEEIAAQRRAQAEKEQIEKKEEALKKKQDELDKQRKKAEYNRNLQSILVSGAMTISNAFATQPFVPVGLAMGALATTLTAYQYAMAKKAKPYATGGVIEGKSHKDGGVPVLGGRVSVEGGEFITNKRTTAKNTPLLEYINSKKKRIDLADMVEFFNDKPRATIKNIRSKFADGGTLPSTIDVREQLRDVIVYQDSRPVVVSVVDVINKSNDVRRVQALAGL